ncbi:hypothetical protein RU07_18680 [Agrobacterium tumefaciens]|uniref:Fimbrial biogenesis outer membrane usher protein n=1 Tax=Agrobacterium tumefaciens TaxID=358 RepID=A0A0D0J2C1_AGRTU|nr:hypothetical protein RU07_18680 [Agrobacterium tumefaciens]
MPRRNSKAASVRLASTVGLVLLSFSGQGFGHDNTTSIPSVTTRETQRDLQLEVFVNGTSTGLIAALRQGPDGRLTIEPEQLRNCGLSPADDALVGDGWVDVSKLPGVSFEYDEANQTIAFTAALTSLAAHKIRSGAQAEKENPIAAVSNTGGLINFSVYASSESQEFRDPWSFSGASGSFEGRLFSPLGLVTSSQIVSLSPNELYTAARLDTAWSYNNPDNMMSYRIGDTITGGLNWTRPVRLAGVQIQRNFGLRPDLVTMPLPELSGTAAVPSTVDIYVDNARRLSQEVPAGPFSISDVPVFTGNATARLVVRDGLGRETITETPLYASSSLLAEGLFDYSVEMGYARRAFGIESFSYDERLMGTATGRYGVADWLTLESHGEAGSGFWNAGFGSTIGLGSFGIGTASGAISQDKGTGFLASASLETEFWGMQWRVSTQRTFGDYSDIATVTANPSGRPSQTSLRGAAPPRALDQISVSMPLGFDPTTLNLNFTQIETVDQERSRIVGVTASRSMGERGNAFISAYADLEQKDAFGIFAGISWSFGNGTTASSGVTHDANGSSLVSEFGSRRQLTEGDLDVRLSDTEGAKRSRAASAAYRGSTGRIEGRIEQVEKAIYAHAQVDGSLVIAGGDIFLSDTIDDAFAIIDTGAPQVGIEFENRPIGKTNRNGKLLVSDLRSYETNAISIDPATIPMDASIDATAQKIVPHFNSGVVVRFKVEAQEAAVALVLYRMDGSFVEPGALVKSQNAEFVVGYDGLTYITGLRGRQTLIVEVPGRAACEMTVELGSTTSTPRKTQDVICGDSP